jgi:hypothetical protein
MAKANCELIGQIALNQKLQETTSGNGAQAANSN